MTAAYLGQYRHATEGFEGLTTIDQVRAPFGETAAASFRFMRDEGLSTSRGKAYAPFIDKRESAIKELLGDVPVASHVIDLDSPQYRLSAELLDAGEIELDDNREIVAKSPRATKALGGRLDHSMVRSMAITRQLHRLYPDKVESDESIAEQVKADLAARRAENQRVLARGGAGAAFAGAAAGAVTDPFVLATMPMGAGYIRGPSILWNAARGFGSEFLIGAATETAIQAEVWDFKASIESPYSKGEAILNVLAAGVGGGVFRGTVGAAIDVTQALRAAMSIRGAARVLEDAGIDPQIASRIVDEMETRAASKPDGVTLEQHSAAIDRAIHDVSAGRMPEVDLPLPGVREAESFIDTRQAELVADAGERMTRGERKSLEQELKALNQRLKSAGSQRRFRELTQAEKDQGTTGRKAKQAATKSQRAEVAEVTEMVRRLEARLAKDDSARKAEADLSRLEQNRRKMAPEELAKSIGYKPRTELAKAIREAVGEREGLERVSATPLVTERPSKPVRVAAEKPEPKVAKPKAAKPKVDKGAVPAEARVPETVIEPEPVPDSVPDVGVAVGERADGTLDVKPARAAVADLNARLAAVERVNDCLLREAA